jgi:hypothetical protein
VVWGIRNALEGDARATIFSSKHFILQTCIIAAPPPRSSSDGPATAAADADATVRRSTQLAPKDLAMIGRWIGGSGALFTG